MKYRKKPVIVQAFQMTKEFWESKEEHPLWFEDAIDKGVACPYSEDEDSEYETWWGVIKTLEGEHRVSWDDWVIRGVKGELYPCKPDIFEKTYESCMSTPYPIEGKETLNKEPKWK